MSALLSQRQLDRYLEQICEHGCARVNQLIERMDNGAPIHEIRHLPKAQQKQVLEELRAVMSVYDNCEVSSS